jgi:hypothetical protein
VRRESWRFPLYVVLYTLFWAAISVILFRTFFREGAWALEAGPYFFLLGLFWFVCAGLRTLSRAATARRAGDGDPIILSLALSGLLLILYANIA